MERFEIPHLLVPVECSLGEGPLWHPERDELFWTDINGKALFACDAEGGSPRRWAFPEAIGSLALISRAHLLLASETALWRFDVETAEAVKAWDLPNLEGVRSNDGRCAPNGDFWIGSMGWRHERDAGAIRRVTSEGPQGYREGITVANSIAFAPDGRTAYWCDTPDKAIRRQPLDAAGAPEGPDELFVRTEGWPDGSVCDAEGFLWNAEWDGARLVRYAPDGRVDRTLALPVSRPTCPAFGGPGLTRLFVTTARTGLDQGTLKAEPGAGGIFAMDVDVAGVPEPRFRHLDGWTV